VVDVGYRGDLGNIAWSPDGKRLVYDVARFGSKSVAHALFVVGARGGRPHQIGPWRRGEANTLDWSPDGARLLVQFTPPDSSFGGDYYTIRPDGSGLHGLTHFGPKATTGSAGWSPDGKSIVFANVGVGGNDDVYVMRADGTGITPVTDTPTWESAPTWGPAR
jgi:TolB protein